MSEELEVGKVYKIIPKQRRVLTGKVIAVKDGYVTVKLEGAQVLRPQGWTDTPDLGSGVTRLTTALYNFSKASDLK